MCTPPDCGHGQPEVWIGLARVVPQAGNKTLGRACGAVVPVLVLACSQSAFVTNAVNMLGACAFDVAEFEDIETLAQRLERYVVSDDINALATSLSNDNPVAFGTFQAYTNL